MNSLNNESFEIDDSYINAFIELQNEYGDDEDSPSIETVDNYSKDCTSNKSFRSSEKALDHNEKFHSYYLKLSYAYRFRPFNSSEARKNLFYFKNRPCLSEWSDFIEYLIKRKMISHYGSKKSIYRFNLKTVSNTYLVFPRVLKILTKVFAKCTGRKATASYLRCNLSYKTRPSVVDWQNFLEDLARENILIIENLDYGLAYFKMK